MSKSDFFFGKVYQGLNGATLRLRDMEPLVRKVSAEFFTAQLDRILKEHSGRLTISDETSSPRFLSFIDKVATEQIGFVEIYYRHQINDKIDGILACDIGLLNGVISVKPHWCVYESIRADELISTLLVPLHLKALQNKAYIRWDNGKIESLRQNDYYLAELQKVFDLSRCSLAMIFGNTREQKFKEYKIALECATEVGNSCVSSEKAWDNYLSLLSSRL